MRNSVYLLTLKKSKSLLFGKVDLNLLSPLTLNDEPIEFLTEWKYLGCTIVSGKSILFSISSELRGFYCSSNSILRSKMIQNELVLMNFLYSHCVPIITNCAEVKDLSSADLNKCNVALNDSIRFIFSYNRWESTRFLRQQLNFPNIWKSFTHVGVASGKTTSASTTWSFAESCATSST